MTSHMLPEIPPVPITGQAAYHHPDDLHNLRLWVRDYAIQAGLPASRAELLMLAVSELATNTLMYTSNGGLVQMHAETGGLVCEVTDNGPVSARASRPMPPPQAPRGRGLAIVEQVCDNVALRTEGARTVVRLWVKSA